MSSRASYNRNLFGAVCCRHNPATLKEEIHLRSFASFLNASRIVKVVLQSSKLQWDTKLDFSNRTVVYLLICTCIHATVNSWFCGLRQCKVDLLGVDLVGVDFVRVDLVGGHQGIHHALPVCITFMCCIIIYSYLCYELYPTSFPTSRQHLLPVSHTWL